MKFVALPEFDDVTSALNFDTADCHVIGGCDLYTTKAAGKDKKLYKNIESSLESQYDSLVKLQASLGPSDASAAAESLNMSRSSPFGPLSQISSRRTYAYLIATLNASHPDYDFSHILRPADFKRERHLKHVMNNLDTALYNLRPRASSSYLSVPTDWSPPAASACPPSSSHTWGPRMWKLIDKEMTLRECTIYRYSPEEDPYDGEDGAIWSYSYFFFNKERKRVCYIYLRGISILSHSPSERTPIKSKRQADDGWSTPDPGAKKRARYWLGDMADMGFSKTWSDDEDDIEEDDENEMIRQLEDQTYLVSDSDERSRGRSKSTVRTVSEDIAEAMEV